EAAPLAPSAVFGAMLANPWRLLIGQTLFLGAVTYVVSFQIQNGIERVAKIMMPGFFILLVVLAVYAAFVGDFARALSFLFVPDFSAVTMKTVMLAVGQAFFSIAIGLGIMITFGSYLPRETSLMKTAAAICLTDTLVAVIAGMAIFPLLFAQGIDASGGPGLIFVTMPGAFSALPGGGFFTFLFFGFLFLATFTTGIGTLEAAVGWLVNRGTSRRKAAWLCGGGAWFVALGAMLSFNLFKDVRPLAMLVKFKDNTLFDTLDLIIANLLLPVNGLLLALFVGWALQGKFLKTEIAVDGAAKFYPLWHAILKYLIPVAIIAILVSLFG
ncbi:MAG: sodium-dependent transporter, partial [Kordiimonadaceae bacterium]|nr:sodium-dependent transporter [Kordiimonadaceae bacterium]